MKKAKDPSDYIYENPIYRDQAPYHASLGRDRVISATYTPFGIQNLDGWYCHCIRYLPNKKVADQLRKEIKNNIHLHRDFKDNLLGNLKNARRDLRPDSQKRFDDMMAKVPAVGSKVRPRFGLNKGILCTVESLDYSAQNYWRKGRIGVTSKAKGYWPGIYGDYYYGDEVECQIKREL